MHMMHMPSRTALSGRHLRGASLFLILVVILFLGFYRNQWHVVREKKFKEFQLDSESLVIARMVESRQHGLLAHNGLLGWGDVNPLDLNDVDYAHQYDVFLADQAFQTYSLYKSASGTQALVLSAARDFSPFSPAVDLRNFRALQALLLATVLSVFVFWTLQEFGLLTAVLVLVTTVLSQWITLYGRNLFYCIWASFLGLGLMLWHLSRSAAGGKASRVGIALVGFGAILFKSLMNGYDFIIPVLSMPVVPVLYYATRDRWDRRRLIQSLAALVAAMMAAVVVSLLILAIQLQTSEGGLAGGLTSIWSTFSRRTYADPDLFPAYADSLKASAWSVLWTYISEDAAIVVLGLRFLDLLCIFAALTVAYLVFLWRRPNWLPDHRKSRALLVATWLALLSPISWFLLFKGQAYVHTHTNYLAWHMPFTLFGYAMCGWLIRCMAIGLTRRDAAQLHGAMTSKR